MNINLIIGIDPSFSKTGVTYIDLNNKVLKFKKVSPEGTNETYSDTITRASEIANSIIGDSILEFAKINNLGQAVIMEEPLVTSLKSSRLGILSGVLIKTLLNQNYSLYYTLNPSVVSSTNRKVKGYTSKTRKNISLQKGLEYIEIFKKHNFKILIDNDKYLKDGSIKPRKISSDECESLIMAILLSKELEVLPKELLSDLMICNRSLTKNYELNILKEERK